MPSRRGVRASEGFPLLRSIFSDAGRICGVAAFALSACSGGISSAGNGSVGGVTPRIASSGAVRPEHRQKIQHVIIVVQENRSFDNLFQGFPGADAQSYGYTSKGVRVTLQPVGLATAWDIDHSSGAYFDACDGHGDPRGSGCKMDGFDKEYVGCGGRGEPPCPNQHPQYGYVPHAETKPYFAMAKSYVLADRMFASNFDGSSFVAHQYLVAGQSATAVDYPLNVWGCDGGSNDTIGTVTLTRGYGPRVPVCFDERTLADELDAARLSWRYYTSDLGGNGGIWSAFQAIYHIRYGRDWGAKVVSPQTVFFQDVKKGRLPAVSWVTPTAPNSDHAGFGSSHGPDWVASLVNAAGNSPYWKSSVIFVTWDDYGGWYDHVPPPLTDYDGLGIRVPLLVISPYAKKAYVSHVRYEHASILSFVENVFGLGRLAASDKRANAPRDCFNFYQTPRPFEAIATTLKQAYFEHEPPDHRVPDTQ